jgi:SsrA-binding protein
MATKEASSSKKPAAASSGKSASKPSNLSAKAAAAAVRIADNKKATFNYHIEERFEAGMVLEGWEVKSVREGKVQLTDGYVVIRNGELFIIGCQINPLGTASTHIRPDSIRTKKLLMHKDEIRRLIGKTEQKGFTLVPLNMHWKAGKVKCEIGLAKGEAEHDKRDTIKDREGKREADRAMKSRNR